MSSIKRWWDQPDQFDWITHFLSQRGLLRSAQVVMAIVAASASLVPLTLLAGLRKPTAEMLAVGAAAAVFTIGLTVFWLMRWPTRWQSELAVVIGTVCIAAWSVSQSSAAVAVLACTASAVTGGYMAFLHSTKLLLFNFTVAVVIAISGSLRLAHDTDVATAAAAFWLIWFLNLSVPLAVRGMSRTIGVYAMRADADPLTGLLNRRGFVDIITGQLGNPHATGKHLSVLMIDIDNFKRVNDTHGHAAGDRALLAVAELLRHHAPPTAAICRAGGEEFLVAMPTESTDAASVASRICSAIAALPHRVTASIGISSAAAAALRGPASVSPIEDLIAAADTAMYVAKRNGGNQAQPA